MFVGKVADESIGTEFVDEFTSSYQRNNKRNGQKNLRCFPRCCAKGHHEFGFCGTPLTVCIKNLNSITSGKLLAFGKVMLLSEYSTAPIAPAIYLVSDTSLLRSRAGPMNEWLQGHVDATNLVFNEDLVSWHYHWVSTKHTCEQLHCFKVDVFSQLNDGTVLFLKTIKSPEFKIFSRRRQLKTGLKTGILETEDKKRKQPPIKDSSDFVLDQQPIVSKIFVHDDERMTNRTLDRLWLAVQLYSDHGSTFSMPKEASSHGGTSSMSSLTDTFAKSGIIDGDSISNNINLLSKSLIDLGRDNTDLQSMLDKWRSQYGVNMFVAQTAMERENKFTWTSDHEDETFNKHEIWKNTEISIFAEVRQAFRNMMQKGLLMHSMDVSMFHFPMQVAANAGVIVPDTFVPPPVHFAKYLHAQVRGHVKDFESQDYGSRGKRFESLAQQEIYGRELMLFKRAVFREIVRNAMVESQRDKKLMFGVSGNPLPKEFGVNGTWIDRKIEGDEEGETIRRCRNEFETNFEFGNFIGRMFHSMFAKIKLRVNDAMLSLEGQQMMLASSKMVILLDGRIHNDLQFSMPMPIDAVSREHTYLAFIDKHSEPGWLKIVVAFAGDAPSTCKSDDSLASGSKKSPLSDLKAKYPEDTLKFMSVRVFHFCAEDTNSFFIRSRIFIFPELLAPQLTPENVASMANDRDKYKEFTVAIRTQNYLRMFLSDDETSQMLDLLIPE